MVRKEALSEKEVAAQLSLSMSGAKFSIGIGLFMFAVVCALMFLMAVLGVWLMDNHAMPALAGILLMVVITIGAFIGLFYFGFKYRTFAKVLIAVALPGTIIYGAFSKMPPVQISVWLMCLVLAGVGIYWWLRYVTLKAILAKKEKTVMTGLVTYSAQVDKAISGAPKLYRVIVLDDGAAQETFSLSNIEVIQQVQINHLPGFDVLKNKRAEIAFLPGLNKVLSIKVLD
ncbi:hypothetical protein [Mucilaginibacter lappiensis]|uniref:FlaA1/EpsC-like NDP-sugar epimerase n=1 Tax=Mucilaginibacter lappiensis TaxID=354630 RepID=A0A841JP42_9SPHI|nr:hypothetical protein [Mucilaginibacter lappiensis]MBB6130095.1 FlaA1/EpsC-like NDP-sugar epimerase [Mucilaginibacter lappiensis]